tara:strand:- start:178 stop:633 length:456 start_codon:yes stop_codon:yes gene_type:complete
MRKRYYIGADPGKSGAICAVDFEGVAEVITKTNRSYAYIWDKVFQPRFMKSIAVIESVHAMPGQGVSSTFKFGESFGMLLGILTALEIPFTRVTPAAWCKELGLKKGKEESNTDWKNRHKQLAQELFPDINVTHATADALLIAEYCRRTNK